MAATSSVLSILKAGDHVLACEDVYGGTHRILSGFFKRFHLAGHLCQCRGIPGRTKKILEAAQRQCFEIALQPTAENYRFAGGGAYSERKGTLVLVDTTFMSPYLQRPLELGADVVIHSATKFIGGHSDVVGGLVAVKEESLAKRIRSVQNSFGAILGPQDSWLLLRGLKTLKVRMDFQQKNAQRLAEWLSSQEQVSRTYYPGLEGHQGRDILFSG